jgi:hypothetical protein
VSTQPKAFRRFGAVEMQRAEQLFERIRAGQAGEIENMVSNPVVEELFLDYKRAATVLPSNKLHDDDRKNLAKAISGFGNSEGGLIVWGVDCKQGPSGDIPLSPTQRITQPIAFKTLLDNAAGGLTLPAHQGVENLPALSPDGTGFVVTYVPIGMNVPFQTLFPKQEFYIRAGSNFFPASRSVLAGLFGNRPHPDLGLEIRKDTFERSATMSSPGHHKVELKFKIRCLNTGRGIADDLFFNVEHDIINGIGFAVLPLYPFTNIWDNQSNGIKSTTLIAKNLSLPPGSNAELAGLSLSLWGETSHDACIRVSCGAANALGVAKELRLPWDILNEAYTHYNINYPTESSKRDGDRHVSGLFAKHID